MSVLALRVLKVNTGFALILRQNRVSAALSAAGSDAIAATAGRCISALHWWASLRRVKINAVD
ncbi:hypothetical protein ABTN15_19095, partial [Acinetobacter baumannii]